jgi:integral membrane protein (TIGR00529 family)
MMRPILAVMIWAGFLISLASILIISRINLALALISGAIILGFFTLSPATVLDRIVFTGSDPSILMLALAVGIIPVIGGTMKTNGQIDALVDNLRLPRKYLLALSPALMGLLPIPGGALLSAPILEKAGADVPGDILAAINNWFRHTLIMVYPLSAALIVSTQIADLDIYRAILHLLPGFGVALALGYVAYLRHIDGRLVYHNRFSLRRLLVPLVVILSAPVLDFVLKRTLAIDSLATLCGVSTALLLSLLLSRIKINPKEVILGARPWNFSFIIIGMFLYLHIFQASDIRHQIAAIPLPPLLLAVSAGFLLGLFTGRVQLPASIILPVYLATAPAMTPPYFAIIYIAIFFGFVVSPVHPCLVVTGEYFKVPLKDIVTRLSYPAAVIVAAVLILSVLLV